MARLPNQTKPQVAVGGTATDVGGSKNNPELAKRTSQLLLSETKATLPFNVQKHVQERSVYSAERARQLQTEMKNVYDKKTHE